MATTTLADLARRFVVLDCSERNTILVYVDGTLFPPTIGLESIENVRVFRSGGVVAKVSLSRYSAPDTTTSTVAGAWHAPCPETGALPEELWPDSLSSPTFMVMHLRFEGGVGPDAEDIRYVFQLLPAHAETVYYDLGQAYADYPDGVPFLTAAVPPFVSMAHRRYALEYMGGVYESMPDDMSHEDVVLLEAKRIHLAARYASTTWVIGQSGCKRSGARPRQAVGQLRRSLSAGQFPETWFCNEIAPNASSSSSSTVAKADIDAAEAEVETGAGAGAGAGAGTVELPDPTDGGDVESPEVEALRRILEKIG